MLRNIVAFVFGLCAGIALIYVMDGPLNFGVVGREAGQIVEGAGRGARKLRLEASVRAALALQKDFSLLGGIDVGTDGGVVTLSGSVSSEDQRTLAELITRGVEGVDEVVNNLEVVPR